MLAIVIPFYKIDFFRFTLKSIEDQSDKRFNVYVGDDASDSSPRDLLEEYRHLNIKYHRFSENLGKRSLTEQWHRCVEMVDREEWVLILGDDDTLGSNCVKSFYNHLENINNRDINVVRYASIVIDAYGNKISKKYTHPKIELTNDFIDRKFKGKTRSSLSEYVFKKRELQKVRFKNLPLAWNSDLLAVIEVSYLKEIFTINEAVVSFRLSGINITSKTNDYVIKNIATFRFLYYLLTKHLSKLQNSTREILLIAFEKTFIDNKRSITRWFLFTNLYLRRCYFLRYLKFVYSCIVYLSKH